MLVRSAPGRRAGGDVGEPRLGLVDRRHDGTRRLRGPADHHDRHAQGPGRRQLGGRGLAAAVLRDHGVDGVLAQRARPRPAPCTGRGRAARWRTGGAAGRAARSSGPPCAPRRPPANGASSRRPVVSSTRRAPRSLQGAAAAAARSSTSIQWSPRPGRPRRAAAARTRGNPNSPAAAAAWCGMTAANGWVASTRAVEPVDPQRLDQARRRPRSPRCAPGTAAAPGCGCARRAMPSPRRRGRRRPAGRRARRPRPCRRARAPASGPGQGAPRLSR